MPWVYGNHQRITDLARLEDLFDVYLSLDPRMKEGNPFLILGNSLDVLRPEKRVLSLGRLCIIHGLLPPTMQRKIPLTARDLVAMMDESHDTHCNVIGWKRYSRGLRRILRRILEMIIF